MSKKILLSIIFLCLITPIKISANEKDVSNIYTKSYLEDYFQELDDSDLVLEMPNGGYLHGEATILDLEGNIISTVSSQTDEKAKTVGEIKEELLGKEIITNPSFIMARGSTPPTKMLEIKKGTTYRSNYFSGKGWRFSGYSFFAKEPYPATGGIITFQTFNDDGRVGILSEALKTQYTGAITGTAVYRGKPYSVFAYSTGEYAQIYYTYNPNPNTFYTVSY
ncbi:hypothetical protein GSF08_10165 [Clostridiaceae bacterium DONG20-135]|uniref:Uncharacterized protein n=1 Tax=Copranaerobaculum intestinale TaxID=2692629 RepID=A0A6N8UCS5_9FIRM|nr:hypothetical protein [Copranaerobaculum intestinale]MXQ74289.1 hypothetical protein [Copranaerobaculum intestinale]